MTPHEMSGVTALREKTKEHEQEQIMNTELPTTTQTPEDYLLLLIDRGSSEEEIDIVIANIVAGLESGINYEDAPSADYDLAMKADAFDIDVIVLWTDINNYC